MSTVTDARPIAPGDRIAVRRHSGVSIRGTVTAVHPWEESCAGTPMRWIDFTDSTGMPRMVADTPHRDNDITVLS